MPDFTPEQCAFLRDAVFLPALTNEQQLTARVIGAIPADQAGYLPDPSSKPALEIAKHIVTVELMFLDGVIAGSFGASSPETPDASDGKALAAGYLSAAASRTERLRQVPAEQLAKVLDFHGVFRLPAVLFVNFATAHGIHHRGQLSVYLRPMGGKVPAIYGESYNSRLEKGQ